MELSKAIVCIIGRLMEKSFLVNIKT